MEEKLRKKKIRNALLVIIMIASVIGIGLSMNIERADYGKVLGEEIEKAQELLEGAQTGYDKGQYLPEAISIFQKCIDDAKSVFEDEEAVYENQKTAYEKLKESEKAFKASVNEKDIEKKAVKEKKERIEEKLKTEASEKTKKEKTQKVRGKKEEAKEENITVTISIQCNNLEGYGVILEKTEYTCSKGSTVYDVLYLVCRNNNIQIESQYTPVYNSQYIEAIDHIYEFDGGPESGWMFRVNGGYPDYACSSYILDDGDSIVWAYTCNLGKDIGDLF